MDGVNVNVKTNCGNDTIGFDKSFVMNNSHPE
jgi:hypothetical protein